MKNLLVITFLFSVKVIASSLPNCPSDINARWHNCFGILSINDGNKYVGEWNDNKFHGQGTYTWKDGTIEPGYYMKGEYVPDICSTMGLKKVLNPLSNVS